MKSVKKWHDYKAFRGGIARGSKLFISGHV